MHCAKTLLIAVMLLVVSGQAMAWDYFRYSGFAKACSSSTSHNGAFSTCTKGNSGFEACAESALVSARDTFQQYVAEQQGDGYVYQGRIGQYLAANVFLRTGLCYYRQSKAEYDPSLTINQPGDENTLIYGTPYTDQQCQAAAGGDRLISGITADQAEAGFTTVGGACGMAAVSNTIASGTDANGVPWVSAEWQAVSSGSPAQPNGGDAGDSSDFAPPDYMTPVESDDGICSTGSCVTIDGQTYHVDQSAIDDGTVTIGDGDSGGGDSGGGIEWGDGSGTATPGTSTDDDGDPLGMGDGTDDSTLGDVVGAIDSLKSSLRNGIEGLESSLRDGFDGLVEGMSDSFSDSLTEFGNDLTDVGGLDGDGAVEGSLDGQGVTEDLAGTLEDEHGSVVDEKLEEYGEKIDSDGGVVGSALDAVRSLVTSYLPNLPSGGCSPVTFSFSGGAFTVDCEVFNIIKSALSFLMFFFTAYEITSIALSYRHSV